MNENKTNINWYPGHMAKTKRLIQENLNLIDVVYEVVDARMPYSSKIKDLDEFIKNKPREVVVDPKIIEKQCDLIEQIHFKGAEVLLSNHLLIPMKTDELVELCLFLEQRKPDMIKIVASSETDEDMLECFKSMLTIKKEIETPVTLFCNGATGPLTRIINPMLGGCLVFTSDGFNARSNFTQLDLQTIKRVLDGVEKLTL